MRLQYTFRPIGLVACGAQCFSGPRFRTRSSKGSPKPPLFGERIGWYEPRRNPSSTDGRFGHHIHHSSVSEDFRRASKLGHADGYQEAGNFTIFDSVSFVLTPYLLERRFNQPSGIGFTPAPPDVGIGFHLEGQTSQLPLIAAAPLRRHRSNRLLHHGHVLKCGPRSKKLRQESLTWGRFVDDDIGK